MKQKQDQTNRYAISLSVEFYLDAKNKKEAIDTAYNKLRGTGFGSGSTNWIQVYIRNHRLNTGEWVKLDKDYPWDEEK